MSIKGKLAFGVKTRKSLLGMLGWARGRVQARIDQATAAGQPPQAADTHFITSYNSAATLLGEAEQILARGGPLSDQDVTDIQTKLDRIYAERGGQVTGLFSNRGLGAHYLDGNIAAPAAGLPPAPQPQTFQSFVDKYLGNGGLVRHAEFVADEVGKVTASQADVFLTDEYATASRDAMTQHQRLYDMHVEAEQQLELAGAAPDEAADTSSAMLQEQETAFNDLLSETNEELDKRKRTQLHDQSSLHFLAAAAGTSPDKLDLDNLEDYTFGVGINDGGTRWGIFSPGILKGPKNIGGFHEMFGEISRAAFGFKLEKDSHGMYHVKRVGHGGEGAGLMSKSHQKKAMQVLLHALAAKIRKEGRDPRNSTISLQVPPEFAAEAIEIAIEAGFDPNNLFSRAELEAQPESALERSKFDKLFQGEATNINSLAKSPKHAEQWKQIQERVQKQRVVETYDTANAAEPTERRAIRPDKRSDVILRKARAAGIAAAKYGDALKLQAPPQPAPAQPVPPALENPTLFMNASRAQQNEMLKGASAQQHYAALFYQGGAGLPSPLSLERRVEIFNAADYHDKSLILAENFDIASGAFRDPALVAQMVGKMDPREAFRLFQSIVSPQSAIKDLPKFTNQAPRILDLAQQFFLSLPAATQAAVKQNPELPNLLGKTGPFRGWRSARNEAFDTGRSIGREDTKALDVHKTKLADLSTKIRDLNQEQRQTQAVLIQAQAELATAQAAHLAAPPAQQAKAQQKIQQAQDKIQKAQQKIGQITGEITRLTQEAAAEQASWPRRLAEILDRAAKEPLSDKDNAELCKAFYESLPDTLAALNHATNPAAIIQRFIVDAPGKPYWPFIAPQHDARSRDAMLGRFLGPLNPTARQLVQGQLLQGITIDRTAGTATGDYFDRVYGLIHNTAPTLPGSLDRTFLIRMAEGMPAAAQQKLFQLLQGGISPPATSAYSVRGGPLPNYMQDATAAFNLLGLTQDRGVLRNAIETLRDGNGKLNYPLFAELIERSSDTWGANFASALLATARDDKEKSAIYHEFKSAVEQRAGGPFSSTFMRIMAPNYQQLDSKTQKEFTDELFQQWQAKHLDGRERPTLLASFAEVLNQGGDSELTKRILQEVAAIKHPPSQIELFKQIEPFERRKEVFNQMRQLNLVDAETTHKLIMAEASTIPQCRALIDSLPVTGKGPLRQDVMRRILNEVGSEPDRLGARQYFTKALIQSLPENERVRMFVQLQNPSAATQAAAHTAGQALPTSNKINYFKALLNNAKPPLSVDHATAILYEALTSQDPADQAYQAPMVQALLSHDNAAYREQVLGSLLNQTLKEDVAIQKQIIPILNTTVDAATKERVLFANAAATFKGVEKKYRNELFSFVLATMVGGAPFAPQRVQAAQACYEKLPMAYQASLAKAILNNPTEPKAQALEQALGNNLAYQNAKFFGNADLAYRGGPTIVSDADLTQRLAQQLGAGARPAQLQALFDQLPQNYRESLACSLEVQAQQAASPATQAAIQTAQALQTALQGSALYRNAHAVATGASAPAVVPPRGTSFGV